MKVQYDTWQLGISLIVAKEYWTGCPASYQIIVMVKDDFIFISLESECYNKRITDILSDGHESQACDSLAKSLVVAKSQTGCLAFFKIILIFVLLNVSTNKARKNAFLRESSFFVLKWSFCYRHCLNPTGDKIYQHGAGIRGIVVQILAADSK